MTKQGKLAKHTHTHTLSPYTQEQKKKSILKRSTLNCKDALRQAAAPEEESRATRDLCTTDEMMALTNDQQNCDAL